MYVSSDCTEVRLSPTISTSLPTYVCHKRFSQLFAIDRRLSATTSFNKFFYITDETNINELFLLQLEMDEENYSKNRLKRAKRTRMSENDKQQIDTTKEAEQTNINSETTSHGENTPRTTDSSRSVKIADRSDTPDAFHRFVEAKVASVQKQTNNDKAMQIQTAIAKLLKDILKEVEKLEPLFRVAEVIQVGSYAEGTKIIQADEFDFLAVIEALSLEGTVVLENNEDGLVSALLDQGLLNTELARLCEEGVLKCFQAPSMAASFSGPERFGTIFVKAVRNAYKSGTFPRRGGRFADMAPEYFRIIGGGLEVTSINGSPLILKEVQCRLPNILLEFTYEGIPISVDLSPAIRYHKIDDCIDSTKCVNPELMRAIQNYGSLLLVGSHTEGRYRITVTESEVEYMQGIISRDHKLLYILLKYMCHRFTKTSNRAPFSSYMLKQICLRHDAEYRSGTEQLSGCVAKIIEHIRQCCIEKHLSSVLNNGVNLFNLFSLVDGRIWHLRLHFLHVLQGLQQRSKENSTYEEFRGYLNDAIDKSAQQLSDFHKDKPVLHLPDDMSCLFSSEKDGHDCPVCCKDIGVSPVIM